MNLFFDVMAVVIILVYFSLKFELLLPVIIFFLLLYILKNARRPLLVDVAGDIMEKEERATVLSVDSQLKSLFVVILAPLFGYVATRYSIEMAFLLTALGILFINLLLKRGIK